MSSSFSTYDTDYCLVKEDDLDRAVETLKQSGYQFDDHSPWPELDIMRVKTASGIQTKVSGI